MCDWGCLSDHTTLCTYHAFCTYYISPLGDSPSHAAPTLPNHCPQYLILYIPNLDIDGLMYDWAVPVTPLLSLSVHPAHITSLHSVTAPIVQPSHCLNIAPGI